MIYFQQGFITQFIEFNREKLWLAFEIAQVKFKLKHDNTSNTRGV